MSTFSELKNNRPMNFKKLQIRVFADYDEEVIDGMYESALAGKEQLEKELSIKVGEIEIDQDLSDNDKYFLIDSISDDSYINQQTTDLIGEMQIIALYKTVEIAINKMLKSSELFTKQQLKSFHKISELKKIFDLSDLKGFHEYNELRCINNCIKHSGQVDNKLANFSGWSEGDNVNNFHPTYDRLKSHVRSFVYSVRDQVLVKVI